MTLFSPGQSPPQVTIAARVCFGIEEQLPPRAGLFKQHQIVRRFAAGPLHFGRREDFLAGREGNGRRVPGFAQLSDGRWFSSEKNDGKHLRGEDAQQRGERIDGGVGDVGRIGTGDVRGEGQRRRIGHASCDQAAEIHVVQLPDATREETDEKERQHRDTRCRRAAIDSPMALNDGGEKLRARPKSDSGKKERDAEFTEGEIRVDRHVPDLAPDPADAAENQRDDQRASSEAEPDRLRQTGEGDRQRAQRDAERDADEERDEVGFVEFFERIAERGRGLRRARRAEHDHNCGQHVEPQALLPQCREEPGPKLQSHGKDEQDQPKLLDEVERAIVNRVAEMPNDHSREKHTCPAQADAAELQAPKRHAKHADEGEYADGMRNGLRLVKLEEPLHRANMPVCAVAIYPTLVLLRLIKFASLLEGVQHSSALHL